MRKFFKHIITVITESVLFGIAIAWYYSVENKYGPLALGVGALSAICTSIYCIFSKDKGKKEVIIEITKEVIEGITERIIAELSKTKPMDEQQRKETEANIQDIIKYYETVDINHASPLYKQAFELFTKGQIDEALALLDEDKMVATEKRSADARILKAQLFYLKNDFENAETNFLKAADIFPSCENNFQVANFYDKQNNFQAAETWYTRCLALAGTPKEKTSILTNLGNLHSDLNDHTKAEEAYKEALQIYRKLADVNPQAYRPDVATTLNKLGNLHQNMNDYLKAEKAYKEALQIRRELADINPQEYRPDVATTLNDLGVLHRNMKDYLKAEEDYKEALQIRRELADVNPQLDRPDVAGTLNNLGALHGEMNDYTKANADYREALQIYRELADVNPQAYRPDVATTLNKLGNLHQNMND
ncbi:MAG: tetratricopeptide repeat protein, partial [Tannerellaceae bacterium]|nr:tetratricopeptide repeat protein [Tannerellaceae bacterium]